MDGCGEKSEKTPSGSNFYKEIIKKYQIGKFSIFRFPRMVFYKDMGFFHPEMINMNILFYLYITNKTIIPSFTVKTPPYMRVMISWFNTKNDLQSIVKLSNVQNINNKIEIFQVASILPWLFHFTSKFLQTFNTKGNPHSEMQLNNIQNANSGEKIFQIALQLPRLYQFISRYFPIFNTKNYLQSVVKLNNIQRVNSETEALQISLHPWLYQFTQRLFPKFNTKNVLYSEVLPKNVRNVYDKNKPFLTALEIPCFHNFTSGVSPINYTCTNRIPITSLLKSSFLKSGASINESNKFVKPLFLDTKAAYYQQVNPVLLDSSMMNSQVQKNENSVKIISSKRLRIKTKLESFDTTMYSTANEKKIISKYHFMFERKSHSILSQNNLLFSYTIPHVNRLFFEHSKLAAIKKPLMQTNYFSTMSDKTNFSPESYDYNAGAENLHFRDTKNIEQEVENIKKIAIETKESLLNNSKLSLGEADIKRYIDINRISDQVYQNIERNIRMERERRGM